MKYHKSWYKGRRFARSRRTRVIQTHRYHGWKIEIIHNGHQTWSFEWIVHPPANKPRGLLRYPKPYTDPTSHRSIMSALDYGRMAVNECRAPFWLKNQYL